MIINGNFFDYSGYTADLFICDLPYNKTACSWDKKSIDLDRLWSQLMKCSHEKTVFVFTAVQPFTTDVINSNRKMFKYSLVWEKQQGTNPMLARYRPLNAHEDIIIFYSRFGTYNPQMSLGTPYGGFRSESKTIGEVYGNLKSIHYENKGLRYPKSVLKYNNVRGGIHPTQKPEELIRFIVRSFSNENDLVVDPMSGSGTTAVICEQESRNYLCFEIDESYFNQAKRRLENVHHAEC